jgi:hypothetical protein
VAVTFNHMNELSQQRWGRRGGQPGIAIIPALCVAKPRADFSAVGVALTHADEKGFSRESEST